jgi:starch synthase
MTTRVLFATAELYPYVKTGGLGDVAAGLPPALKALDTDVRYMLPGYPSVLEVLDDAVCIAELTDYFGLATARLLRGGLPNGCIAYVLDAPGYYDRENPYTCQPGRDWPDNHLRFGALCHAAAHLDAYDPWWRPDVVHGQDWHCGLIPAYLHLRQGPKPASILTIHNIAYQGLFPLSVARALRIPAAMCGTEGCEYYEQFGFLKAGLHYATAITTVSPTYAREICEPDFGCGLEGLLTKRRKDLYGIINGIDTTVWDPATDAALAHHYTASNLQGKGRNKHLLAAEFGLESKGARFMAGVVSRLTPQKGMDRILQDLPPLLDEGIDLVLLGAGDPAIEKALAGLARRYPGQIGLHIGYDESLAHRIIAGADAVLMPSRFEPCGLVQLNALRYGTLPVVTATGGLADTVRDGVTGFSADAAAKGAYGLALRRALDAWQNQRRWKTLQRNAMAEDWSWTASAKKYQMLYAQVAAARQQDPRAPFVDKTLSGT